MRDAVRIERFDAAVVEPISKKDVAGRFGWSGEAAERLRGRRERSMGVGGTANRVESNTA